MRFEAVLFDCDGVLVDSEPITNGVLRAMLGELGWELSVDECMRIFVGKTLHHETELIERHTGRPVTQDWLREFRSRRDVALLRSLGAIPNVHQAVHAIHAAYQGRLACASGADRHKVEMQLNHVGLMRYFEGRIFSGHEMARSKPAPDVYLAAARALGADPARCAVIEDTVVGVSAGVAAGAQVFGYAPTDQAEALRQAGAAVIFCDMANLPGLLAPVPTSAST